MLKLLVFVTGFLILLLPLTLRIWFRESGNYKYLLMLKMYLLITDFLRIVYFLAASQSTSHAQNVYSCYWFCHIIVNIKSGKLFLHQDNSYSWSFSYILIILELLKLTRVEIPVLYLSEIWYFQLSTCARVQE